MASRDRRHFSWRNKKAFGLSFLILSFSGLLLFAVAGKPNKLPAQTASTLVIRSTTTIPAVSRWTRWRESAGAYNFLYPRQVFVVQKGEHSLPLSSGERTKATLLLHQIPSPNCYLVTAAKTCPPELENMAIGFVVVKKNFAEISPELMTSAGQYRLFSLAGHQGITFSRGTKDEGLDYYVVPIDSHSTLFIFHRYLISSFSADLATIPDFLPLVDQKRLLQVILSHLTFGQSSLWH